MSYEGTYLCKEHVLNDMTGCISYSFTWHKYEMQYTYDMWFVPSSHTGMIILSGVHIRPRNTKRLSTMRRYASFIFTLFKPLCIIYIL